MFPNVRTLWEVLVTVVNRHCHQCPYEGKESVGLQIHAVFRVARGWLGS